MKIFLQFFVAMLLTGCNKTETPVEQFIIVSIENGILCSAKSNFNDTIYYENKLPSGATNYSYSLLNKAEKQKFERIIQTFSLEDPLKNFNYSQVESIILLKSDQLKIYNIDWLSQNGKAIYNLMRDLAHKRKETSQIEKFWDVNGFAPKI